MTIRPIGTHYAGHHFRSRLEARWAVFFDTLGIRWEYEPQGFELTRLPEAELLRLADEQLRERQPNDNAHLGSYLPDFWLPTQAAWFEVKGVEPASEEWARLIRFMELTDQRTFVAVGNIPDPRTLDSSGHPYDEGFEIHTYGDHHYAWTRCDWCGLFDLTFDARAARTRCGCHRAHFAKAPCCNGDKCYRGDSDEIVAAYTAARAARFEHGQSGA
uniref:REase associating with pPIWI RE domain-containing protein n=1 Tax=Streptomyces sp. NBC_00093 TaxID=2975649 RepID=A0AAU2A0E9_9ACTN